VIVPTNIQCCCAHNLYGRHEATGAESLNDMFALFGHERGARPLPNLLPHGYDLMETESRDAKMP
jgi:hypothetical protein